MRIYVCPGRCSIQTIKSQKFTSLYEALQPKHDALYAAQPDISFAACELGYFPESEGPQEEHAYQRDGD